METGELLAKSAEIVKAKEVSRISGNLDQGNVSEVAKDAHSAFSVSDYRVFEHSLGIQIKEKVIEL